MLLNPKRTACHGRVQESRGLKRINWTQKAETLHKKGQSRAGFFRSLMSFKVSAVASLILFAVACWGSRLSMADNNGLNKLIIEVR